jgi:hypothetical protein
VKHDRAADVNLIWEKHFSTECNTSKRATTIGMNTTTLPLCAHSKCKKQLGPSNRFHCPKCRKDVCLAHRQPEAHECESMTKKSQKPTTTTTSKTTSTIASTNATTKKNDVIKKTTPSLVTSSAVEVRE